MSVTAREANRRIAAKAIRLRFQARVPFICECSNPDCSEFILLRADEYDHATPLLLPGHLDAP